MQKERRISFSKRMSLFILGFYLLAACSSRSAVPTQPTTDNCQHPGQTNTFRSSSAIPSTAGEWPTFHANLNRNGSAPLATASKLTLAWTYCSGASIFSSPIVHNGVVYIASTDKTLTALDISTGHALWQMHAAGVFFSTPAFANNTLYAATLNGTIYALDPLTGTQHWHTAITPIGSNIWSSPAIVQGLIIFGTASSLSEHPKYPGQLLALDAATGKVRWRSWTQPNAAPGGGIWSSPAVDSDQGIVYAATGDPDDGLQALSLRDGHLLWHWRSLTQDTSDTDIGAGPTLYRDQQGLLHVVVGSKNGSLYSLDAQTGHLLWQTRVGDAIYSSPAYASGTLYTVSVHNHQATAIALAAQTGAPLWQHSIPVIVYASPAIVGPTLYIATGDGFSIGVGALEVLDAATGHLSQSIDLHSPASSSPAVLAHWLFIGAHSGIFYAFTH